MAKYGVRVPPGIACTTPAEVAAAATKLSGASGEVVVKSQVHDQRRSHPPFATFCFVSLSEQKESKSNSCSCYLCDGGVVVPPMTQGVSPTAGHRVPFRRPLTSSQLTRSPRPRLPFPHALTPSSMSRCDRRCLPAGAGSERSLVAYREGCTSCRQGRPRR